MNKLVMLTAVFTLMSFSLVAMNPEDQQPAMGSESLCLHDDSVQCYCSQSCSWRDKTEEDNPVYSEDDPNGKHCYCKEWDRDLYEANCNNGMNVPQPDEAQ